MNPIEQAEAALTVALGQHEMREYSAGNGVTEPRESWADCSCGASLWEWQEYYNENPMEPEDAFRAHVAHALLSRFTITEKEQS